MAIVVDPRNADKMLAYAEENLEAVVVAMLQKAKTGYAVERKQIVNISRAFLNTNGAHQEASAYVSLQDRG